MRILVVEDEPTLRDQLVQAIAAAGHTVEAASDGAQAHYLGEVEDFDAVVLDLGLPVLDGLSVLRRWRAAGRNMPVLILTARAAWHEKVAGMDAGADDYLAKPFDIQELEARLRSLLRRASGKVSPLIACGELQYDTNTRQFSCRGEVLSLTPREHAVMELLIRVPGKTVSKKEMSDKLSTLDETITASALEIYIVRLRKKLENTGAQIVTLRGLGYMLTHVAA